MNDEFELRLAISKERFNIDRIYLPFTADVIHPVGCTTRFAFVVLEYTKSQSFEIARLTLDNDELKLTPYYCAQHNLDYQSPWKKYPSLFKNFIHACIYDEFICLILSDQVLILNAVWEIQFTMRSELFETIHCADMNNDYLVLSYLGKKNFNPVLDEEKDEEKELFQKFIIIRWHSYFPESSNHQSNGNSNIVFSTYLKARIVTSCRLTEENYLFLNDCEDRIEFSVFKIDFDTNHLALCTKQPILLFSDEQDQKNRKTLILSSFCHTNFIVQSSYDEFYVYKDHETVFVFQSLPFAMIGFWFIESQQILIAHDQMNNIHFFDFKNKKVELVEDFSPLPSPTASSSFLSDDQEQEPTPFPQATFIERDYPKDFWSGIGILKHEVLNSITSLFGLTAVTAKKVYPSLSQLSESQFVFLAPDGTLSLIVPIKRV